MNDRDAFLAAILAAPDDDAPRLVYADWLDENGEPTEALSLRRSVHAAREWQSAGAKVTADQFATSVVAQDDDEDYDESGWVAVVVGDRAYLGHYGHCSCYGTWSAICAGGVNDHGAEVQQKWDWVGTPDELVVMAARLTDPCLPCRQADPADYDYDHLIAMYKQVLEWDQKGRPTR